MTTKKEEKQINVRVTEELHRRAKTEAAMTGKPLQEILQKLITMWLNGEIDIDDSET